MNIPNIPYDNIYKFSSVVGLIFIILGVGFLLIGELYLEEKYSQYLAEKYQANLRLSGLESKKTFFDNEMILADSEKSSVLNKAHALFGNRSETVEKLEQYEKQVTELDKFRKDSISILNRSGCYVISPFNESHLQFGLISECADKVQQDPELMMAMFVVDKAGELANSIFHDFETQKLVFLQQEEDFNDLNNKLNWLGNKTKEYEVQISKIEEERGKIKLEYATADFYYDLYQKQNDWMNTKKGYIWIVLLVSLLMFCYGLKNWYKYQKITDEISEKELEIKKLELKRLKDSENHREQ